MPGYVDGYVLPLPKRNLAAYRRLALVAARVWMKHGALEYRECVGDDLDTPMGVGFPVVARAKRGETVVFAWIRYRSRAHRDKVNAKVMQDPTLSAMCGKKMPFDVKRMGYGGFRVIVES
jgi:uncharacterized protein YbaA (DUF1428 family)